MISKMVAMRFFSGPDGGWQSPGAFLILVEPGDAGIEPEADEARRG